MSFPDRGWIQSKAKRPVFRLYFAGVTVISCAVLYFLGGFRSALALNLLHVNASKQLLRRPQSGAAGLSASAAGLGDFRIAGILELSSGNPENALRWLDEAVQQTPRDPVLRFFRGRAFEELGQVENALAEWKLAGPGLVARRYTLLAGRAADVKDVALALRYAGLATTLDPGSGEAWFQFGRTYAIQEKWTDALGAYTRAASLVEEGPLLGRIYQGMGMAFAGASDAQAAARCLEQAVRLRPLGETYHARLELARAYADLGLLLQAAEQAELAMQIDPSDPGAYIQIGDVYAQIGQDDLAQQRFQDAIRVEPGSGRGEYALGRFYLTRGDPQAAIPYLERAIDLGWDLRWVWSDLAGAYRRTGRLDDAVAAYQHIADTQGKNASALKSWIALAQIYTEKQDIPAANGAWHEVLEIEPSNLLALKALGQNP